MEKAHPKFTNYGVDENSNPINIKTKKKLKTSVDQYGYYRVHVRLNNKSYTIRFSRFVYECHNGLITDGDVIDHKDNDISNNKIENLEKITQAENIKRKFDRGYKNVITKKGVIAKNETTGAVTEYTSLYKAGKGLNIVPASVNRVCKGNQKTAISKTDGTHYSFTLK